MKSSIPPRLAALEEVVVLALESLPWPPFKGRAGVRETKASSKRRSRLRCRWAAQPRDPATLALLSLYFLIQFFIPCRKNWYEGEAHMY